MEAVRLWEKHTMGMRDQEGRPLGEAKIPFGQRDGVEMELRTCPYADSRQHNRRPMNVSALKQMFAHWQEALAGLALLRSLYCAGLKSGRLRLIDVWRIGGLTSSVVDFAFLRASAPIGDGCLPAAVAVLYKAPLGIGMSTQAMWADGAARWRDPVDAGALYEYADRHGHFIGPQQVCAGPVAMVKEVLRLVVEGGPAGDASATAAVLGDSQRFLRFCHATSALRLLRMALDRLDAGMGLDLARTLAADPASPTLSESVRRGFRTVRYLGYDAGARLDVLEELLAQAAEPFPAGELGPEVRAVRDSWARPLGDAAGINRVVARSRAGALSFQTRKLLGQHLGRFGAVEQAFAALVCRLKRLIADALGIEWTQPQVRELHLDDYRPAGVRLTRAILREALDVEVRVQEGRLFLEAHDRMGKMRKESGS